MVKGVVAVIAPGAMGSAVGRKLVQAGCRVLTNLDGRSDETRRRADQAGMIDATFSAIVEQAEFILSIIPPKDALALAQTVVEHWVSSTGNGKLVFVDCNAVNSSTTKNIAALFSETSIKFIDACIIGGPPNGTYNPTFYASVDPSDEDTLERFTSLSEYGLKISCLTGEGVGIGDASALKMSYAGITKGITGLFTTMLLAAHASSPTTSEALLRELHASQPTLLERIVRSIPPMLPKAYRWIGEMHEIAGFVGEGEGETYRGIAKTYERIERSMEEEGSADVKALKNFVDAAKKVLEEK